ncbi:MAG TPA: O-antigen ligase family protein [Longimicrobium sp.]|nr:O-antigen ligase family protein [Longimicrobium sp.]
MSTTTAPVPGSTDGYALDFLRFGLLASALAYMPGELLFADAHAFPAELVMHLFAAGAVVMCLARVRALVVDRTDLFLAAFVALSAASALGASSGWFAARALALTVSGAAVFWAARALARDGWGDVLSRFAALAAVAVAATALLEAYGLVGELSLVNRAPGGTLGNRNQMAHLLVLALPALLLHAGRAPTRPRFAGWMAALAVVAAALALSRTRGAWLGVMAVAVAGTAALLVARRHLRGRWSVDRAGLLALAALLGCGAAVTLPNRLQWASQTPYGDTLRGIVNVEYGSGRGRVIQYANTLRMAGDHPLLGVGPGNWAVAYPRYASPGDPSYEPRSPMPTGRLPQGDWLGIAAERGGPALGFLLLACVAAALAAIRVLRREDDPEAVFRGAALLAALAGLAVVGSVDPVLLTPTASFLFFLLAGALLPPAVRSRTVALGPVRRRAALAAAALAGILTVGYGARQAWAGHLYGTGLDLEALARATRVNPGDYRAHMLLAEALVRQRRCDEALPYLRASQALFPTAQAVDSLGARCVAARPAR